MNSSADAKRPTLAAEDDHLNHRAESVSAAVGHLHAATRSMIAAARAFIDAAETLVETPGIFTPPSSTASQDDKADDGVEE